MTKPLVFEGNRLLVNMCVPGGVGQVEIQDADGRPIEGYQLADSCEIRGDSIAHAVNWNDRSTLSSLASRPIRLRFVLKDAELFAFRFAK